MEEPGAMKINNFKKRHNHATAVKGSPKSERKHNTVKEKQTEEVGVLELLMIVSQLTEQITKFTDMTKVLGKEPRDNRHEEVVVLDSIHKAVKELEQSQSVTRDNLKK